MQATALLIHTCTHYEENKLIEKSAHINKSTHIEESIHREDKNVEKKIYLCDICGFCG